VGACPAQGSPELNFHFLSGVASMMGTCMQQIVQQAPSYSSQLTCCDGSKSDYNPGNGQNLLNAPYASTCGSAVTVTVGSCQSYTFNQSGGTYTPRYGAKQTLTAGTSVLTLGNTDGSTIDFNDSGGVSGPPGLFKRYTSAGGDKLEVNAYSGNQIQEVRRSIGSGPTTQIDSYYYAFVTSGVNAGLNETMTLRRSPDNAATWTELRRVKYTYYDGTTTFGNAGDLQMAEEQIKNGSTWTTISTHYFRFYKPGDANGFTHGLKFYVSPDAFSRIPSPLTASDVTVAGYADNYYEYDSSRRVTTSKTNGGQLTYTLAYTDNTDADDYNNWKRKTTINFPNGSLRIIYTNYIGQELLSVLQASVGSSDLWIDYYVYGLAANSVPGLLLQHAHPSAVASYIDNGGVNSKKLVVTLNSSTGLIENNVYYTSTTATSTTPGGAALYLKWTQVQQGSGGTPVRTSQTTYYSRTVGSAVIYPVAESTVYSDSAAANAITTSYAYTWQTSPDTFQPLTITTTLPVVSTAQNGSNSSNVRRVLFDIYGNQTAAQDERGFINTTTFDVVSGAMLQQILDDDAPGGSGWTANSGTRLKLTSDYEADYLGRNTQTLGPVHNALLALSDTSPTSLRTASWMVYDELNNRTLNGQGYATGSAGSYTYVLIDPVSITIVDDNDRPIQTIVSARTTGSGRLSASDTFTQGSYSRWSINTYNNYDQLASSSVYFLIPGSGSGSEGTNFNTTTFGYDNMNRQNRVQSPGGTITKTTFDVRGLVTAVNVGTNDSGSNNMVQVSASVYDSGSAGGDGNLTTATLYAAASDTRLTVYTYDFRNRKTSTKGEEKFYEEYTLDNLGRITETRRKDTDGTGALIGQWQKFYDDRGRVYQSKTFAVASGTAGNALIGNNWYDAAGNLVASIAEGMGRSVYSKTSFDSVGRQSGSYYGYNTTTVSYSNSTTINSSDIIFEQSVPTYDAASNLLYTTSYQRWNDGTGGGALTSSNARLSYVASLFDPIGRTFASVNYGAVTGTFTAPTIVPARSDTVLVTTISYNSAGEGFSQIDPKAIESRQTLDNAGRLITRVDDYGGLAQTTSWTYTADGQTATLKATNSSTGDQTTTYTFGTTLSDSDIARSDLLRYVDYPDSVSGSDQVAMTYNRLGQMTTRTDQRGVVREFLFDKLGRLTDDHVTAIGTADTAIYKISRTYEVRGMVETITSYNVSNAAQNQVKLVYNEFSQLITESQDHSTTVGSSTPNVQYAYANGASSSNQIRPTSVTYPNSKVINWDYGTTDNDLLSRIESIKDGTTTVLGTYTYLGIGTIIRLKYPQPDAWLDLWGGTSGHFAGIDLFGRVTDQLWQNNVSTTPVPIDYYQYGYDRNSNRQYRANKVGTTPVGVTPVRELDEYYTYDNLNRLTVMQRGRLTGGPPPTGISGTPTAEQDWTLDPTGNWNGFIVKAAGSQTLNQTRTQNKVNEITAINETVGSSWIDPAYDAAGNMITGPLGTDPTTKLHFVFDAWNRMVTVKADSSGSPGSTIASYTYDGRNRRITKTIGGHTYHGYYNNNWQYLETRIGTSTSSSGQLVWDLRYIDSPLALLGGTYPLYYTNDANFNVTALIDGHTGAVSERYQYDPYGKVQFYSDAWVKTMASAANNPILYCGYTLDSESGLYLARNRYLNVGVGVWERRDPMMVAQSRLLSNHEEISATKARLIALDYDVETNFYQVVQSNPISNVDPTGLLTVNTTNAAIQRAYRKLLSSPVGRELIETIEALEKHQCIEKYRDVKIVRATIGGSGGNADGVQINVNDRVGNRRWAGGRDVDDYVVANGPGMTEITVGQPLDVSLFHELTHVRRDLERELALCNKCPLPNPSRSQEEQETVEEESRYRLSIGLPPRVSWELTPEQELWAEYLLMMGKFGSF